MRIYKYLMCLLLYGCTVNNYRLTMTESALRAEIEKTVKECNLNELKFNPTPPPPIPDLIKAGENYSLKAKILLDYINELKSYIKQIKSQVVNYKCDQ